MPIDRRLTTGLALALSACVSHSTASDHSSVRALVKERTRLELPEQRVQDPEAVDPDASALAAKGLTLENAIRIALLNNRELRADLLGLGIARGQLVQASLFPNFELEAQLRFSREPEHRRQWDLGAGIDLTQLILRGGRTAASEARLDAARFRAAGSVLDLGYRVRIAYYEVQAGEQQVELARTAMQALAASYEASRELHRAGNQTALDLSVERTAYESARLGVAEAEADLIDARERLNVLLGFFGRDTTWQVSARLPDPQADTTAQAGLEGRAIAASLELAETRASLMAAARSVGVAELSGWLPDISVGVVAERDGPDWAVGPALKARLPVFDRQQGVVISRQAELDALRERYVGDAIGIRAAVRAARARAESAEARARQYRDTLLPLREQVLQQTVLEYNAMQIGVFQLLQARRDQIETGRSYVATLLEYWKARSALEQLLAGRYAGTVHEITAMSARPNPLRSPAATSGSALGH
jgi:cobalt-zinc-cadmium efflux system outer membrane protein